MPSGQGWLRISYLRLLVTPNCSGLVASTMVFFSYHNSFAPLLGNAQTQGNAPLTHCILLRSTVCHYLRVRSHRHFLQKSLHDPYLFPTGFHINFYHTYSIYFKFPPLPVCHNFSIFGKQLRASFGISTQQRHEDYAALNRAMVQWLALAFEFMAMEVHGNLRESFDTSQKENMANPVLLIFLSLKSRIISITLWKEEGWKEERKEGRKKREGKNGKRQGDNLK